MITMLNRVTGVALSILWENVAIRINSIYRKMSAKQLDPARMEWLDSDFHFLKHANGDLFHLDQNPVMRIAHAGTAES
jgi:ferric iron reductase protein FhuF